ncbi:MAG: hypothetical protein AAF589_00635 [Planctomycetota bacterium]
MRISMRMLLLLVTLTAAGSGYARWRVHQDRKDYERYEAPGLVEKPEYWPERVTRFVEQVDERIGKRDDVRVYRHLYNRDFEYVDCFLQMSMTPEEFQTFIESWELQPESLGARRTRAFWRRVPDGWIPRDQVQGEPIYARDYPRRGGLFGGQPIALYNAADEQLNLRFIFDY